MLTSTFSLPSCARASRALGLTAGRERSFPMTSAPGLCCRCGVNPRSKSNGYCSECRKAYRKEHPEKRYPYKRKSPFPELCGNCKQRPHAKGDAWCSECKSKRARKWRQSHGGSWKCLSPEARQRAVVRRYVYTKVSRGQLQRLPCAICGDPNTEAHHHNGYDKAHALDVVWLCYPHHIEAERRIKSG